MRLANLTPHAVRVVTPGGDVVIPPSGAVARVEQRCDYFTEIDVNGVPVTVVSCSYSDVKADNLPLADGYIVSSIVASAIEGGAKVPPELQTRPVFVPDTGPESAVRDESGRIVGVRRFRIVKNASMRQYALMQRVK